MEKMKLKNLEMERIDKLFDVIVINYLMSLTVVPEKLNLLEKISGLI